MASPTPASHFSPCFLFSSMAYMSPGLSLHDFSAAFYCRRGPVEAQLFEVTIFDAIPLTGTVEGAWQNPRHLVNRHNGRIVLPE